MFRNRPSKEAPKTFQMFEIGNNWDCSALSVAQFDSFITASIDAFNEILNSARKYVLSMSSRDPLEEYIAKQGDWIPIDSVMPFKKTFPEAMALFLQDEMKIFQNRLNVERLSVINEISFAMPSSEKQLSCIYRRVSPSMFQFLLCCSHLDHIFWVYMRFDWCFQRLLQSICE